MKSFSLMRAVRLGLGAVGPAIAQFSDFAQSVTIPAQLAIEVQRVYRRFMSDAALKSKGEGGKDLIRAIFGKDGVTEDSIT